MVEQDAGVRQEHLRQPVPPVAVAGRGREIDLPEQILEDRGVQFGRSGDVHVQRRGPGVEFLGQPAHGDALQALCGHEPHRGGDDGVVGEGRLRGAVAAAAG